MATPSPTPTPTLTAVASTAPAATAAATSTPAVTSPPGSACVNTYLLGEEPVVPPRPVGRFAELALDAVVVGGGPFDMSTQWRVRLIVPFGSPGPLEVPLRATVRSSSGAEVAVVRYYHGPPNAGSAEATATIVVDPCDASTGGPPARPRWRWVLVVYTAPISSGGYTLTLRDLKLPEGIAQDHSWQLTLTCAADPGRGPGSVCR